MDETRAWVCLTLNLAVLPGIGTLLGRQRWGYAQAALSLGGLTLTCRFLLWLVREWSVLGEFPLDRGPYFSWGVGGVLSFGVAWLWSFASGLSLVKRARASERR